MGSAEAMKSGSADRYGQNGEATKKFVPEGVTARVPLTGSVGDFVYTFVGGLRATMGYTGSINLAELKKCEFVQITSAGIRESHPHDVEVISGTQ
jgi:IMP dehydrogenase